MALFPNNQDDKNKDKFWFLKAATSAAIAGGAFYGFSKIKGPLGKVVDQITSDKITTTAQKEIAKYIKNPEEFSRGYVPYREQELLRDNYPTQFKSFSQIEVNSLEQELIDHVHTIQWEKLLDIFNKGGPDASSKVSSDFGKEFSLFYSRYSSLERYAQTFSLEPKDAQFIHSVRPLIQKFVNNGVIDNGVEQKINDIHTRYISNDHYRSMYYNELDIIKRKISNVKNFSNGSSEDLLKKAVLGDVTTHLESRVESHILAEAFKKNTILEDFNPAEINKTLIHTIGSRTSSPIKTVDYNPYLKRIDTKLSSLESKNNPVITSHSIKIQRDGNGKQWANITLETHGGKKHTLEIPLAKNMLVPGSSSVVSSYVDMLFAFGGSPAQPYQNNKDLLNSSEWMLRTVSKRLDSDSFISEFVVNANYAIMRLQNELDSILGNLTLYQGKIGQLVLQVYNPEHDKLLHQNGEYGQRYFDKMSYGLSNLSMMSKMVNYKRELRKGRVGRVFMVSLDTETITANQTHQPGIEHVARNPQTHLVQIGVSIGEINNSQGIKVIDSKRFISDHATYSLFRDHLFDPKQVEFLRKVTPGVTSDTPSESVIAAYADHIKQQTDQAGTRAANDTTFADMFLDYLDQFFEHSKIGKLGINDKVVLLTKNGQQYDLPLLKLHASPMKWQRFERKYKDNIDTGSLGMMEQKWDINDKSLGLDAIMRDILNRTGYKGELEDFNNPKVIDDVLTHLERKGYMTIDESVKKILHGSLKQTHGEAVVDTLFNISIFQDFFLRAGKSFGIWNSVEQAKIYRMLNTFNGSASIKDNVLTRLQNDSAVIGGKMFTSFLSSANRATKAALHEMSPGQLFPFGAGSNLSKQVYQNISGHTLTKNINYLPRVGRNIFQKTITTLPMVELELAKQKVDKAAGMFKDYNHLRNTITVRSANVLYSMAETEGLDVLSTDIARQVYILHDMNININSINFGEGSANIGSRLDMFKREVLNEVIKFKHEHPDLLIPMSDIAKRIAERPDIGLGRLPKGTVISSGDLGRIVLDESVNVKDFIIEPIEIDGREDLDIRIKVERKIRMDSAEALKLRDIWGDKAVLTLSDPSQEVNGLFGHDFRSEAKWIKDANISAFKDMAVRRIVGQLQETISSGTIKERDNAKKQLALFARKLKADLVHNEIIFNNKAKTAHYKNLTKDEQQLAHSIYGNIDISWDVINEFMKPVGGTWAEENLRDFYSKFGAGNEHEGKRNAKRLADSLYDTAVSKLRRAGSEALYNVEKCNINRVEAEYRRIIDSVYQPKIGETMFAQWMRSDANAKNSYHALVFSSYTDLSVHSGSITGEGYLYHTLKLSNMVVDHIINSPFVTKTTKDMVLKNRVYYRDLVKQKAKDTIDNFKKQVFSEASTKSFLTLEEIKTLLEKPGIKAIRENRLAEEIENEMKRSSEGLLHEVEPSQEILDQVKDTVFRTIEKFKDDLVMIDNELEDPEKFREYKEKLVDNIISGHRLEKALKNDNTRFVTYEETNTWAKSAEYHKNVFRISNQVHGLPNVFEININKTFNSIYGSKQHNRQNENAFRKMLEDMLQHQRENNIDGPIISMDGDVVKLKELFLPAHHVAANIADRVAGSISRETPETTSSRTFLQSVVAYSNAIEADQLHLNLGAKYSEMVKFWVMHMSNVAIGNKSTYGAWEASNVHVQQLKSKGAESLIAQAFNLKNNGGFSSIFKDEESIMTGNRILSKILNSKFNTTFVTESAFKKMRVDMGDGSRPMLIGEHLNNVDASKSLYNKIISGEQKMIGFSSRYPNEPQGNNAMLDTFIQVIPDKFKKYLLMDDWSAHTFDIFTQLIKMDHDGDVNNIGLSLFRTIEEMNNHHKEIQDSSSRLLEYISTSVDKGHHPKYLGIKPIGLQDDGTVSTFQFNKKTGKAYIGYKEISKSSNEELADLFGGEHFTNFVMEYGTQLPDFLNSRILGAVRIRSALTASIKDIMGVATNSVLRANTIMRRAGLVKDDSIIQDFFGDMKTGLGKFLQDVTGIAKNPSLEKTIALSKQLEVLQGRTHDMEAVEQFKDSFVKSFEQEAMAQGKDEYNLFTNKQGSLYERKRKVIDTYLFVQNAFEQASRNNKPLGMTIRQLVQELMNLPNRGLTSIFNRPEEIGKDPTLNEILRDSLSQPISQSLSLLDELPENFRMKFRLRPENPVFKHASSFAKFGAIGAAVFVAANFFRPNQLSSSANPLDMFVDIDNNINSDNNIFHSDLQLDRGVPLDMVDASFSKQAYIRMNKIQHGKLSQVSSKNIRNLLSDMSNTLPTTGFMITNKDVINNTNYTTSIGKFGSNNFSRRSRYSQ